MKRMGKCAVLGMVALTLILSGATRSRALEWGSKELDTEKLAVTFYSDVVMGGYKLVKTEELKVWIDKKESLLIVDTMPFEDSYKRNHIPGAVQMEFPIEELTQLDDVKKAALEKLLGPDKSRRIVFYCGFTKCTRSHNGAKWAVKLGYTDVYRHPGGIKAWMEADYPVEKTN
jgi:thiosulfate/3-mercaptopyruvate sulfurtransferase